MSEELNKQMIEAVKNGDLEAVKRLLSEGVNPNAMNDGWTVLMIAAKYGYSEIVKALLSANADHGIMNPLDGSALMAAAIWGRLNSVKILINAGADVHAKRKDGETALSRAIEHKRDAATPSEISAYAEIICLLKAVMAK